VDEEKKADEVTTDDKSSEVTPAVAKPSSQKPEFTKEQEAEVLKRVSDELAKRGDKAKDLETKLGDATKFIDTLQAERLEASAKKFGLTVEKLKEVGIEDPKKVEAYATLFGKTGDTLKDDPIPDSGKTEGGLSDEAFTEGIGSGKIPLDKDAMARAKKLGITR